MTDKILTDNELAQQNIFGKAPTAPEAPVEPTPTDPPAEPIPPVEPPIEPPVELVDPPPAEPTDPEPPAEPPVVEYNDMPEEKFLELVNKRFNANFDTLDDASSVVGSQLTYRRQEDIIKKLVEKQKNTNVLSYFESENAYKVNELAKEHPGKRNTLNKIIDSDIGSLTDFEAIELAERMAKPAGTKVDVLGVKLRTMGISDSINDFEEWDEMDKQVVIGAAEDARETLGQLQSKVTVPKEGEEGEIDEFVKGLESGFQETELEQRETIEANTPVVKSLVDSLTKIKPVEGSDFEFDITMSNEEKKDYMDYLLAESVEGAYDVKSDDDIKRLHGSLVQEVWATEGPKIMKAYGEHIKEKTWAEANIKFGNNVPLDDPAPPVDPTAKTDPTDDERARRILSGQ